ncbi:hypothetical protein JDV02_004393 [Purpureocillium takamizusanense]|uniref:Uncharacterized protein n=1 Tax=Purpureocillium takamizusanense TaxID=2060973 RepID=A0A9Q8QF49_9HYPO|nr:uncharacterized protein JDV02_004393 [Purpureocillium takamizusanense]UNI18102.1 hypothetical protein JDV02_004393 [Purpureocillium takamizusanense]
MAPETRSRGVPPPNRVYNSSPALQQVQFPSRRKKIRTYGRRTSLHTPSLRQQTLTQIDFVSSFDGDDDGGDDVITLTDSEDETTRPHVPEKQDSGGDDKENRNPKSRAKGKAKARATVRVQGDGGGDGDGDDDDEPVPVSRRRRRKRPSTGATDMKSKRRRTLGDDIPENTASRPKSVKDSRTSRRRTVGDAPSSSSKYHTQTLTQFLGQRSFIADSDDEGDDLGLVPSEDEGDKGNDDGFMEWLGEPGSPSVRRSRTRQRRSAPPSPQKPRTSKSSQGPACPSREESVIPQTPVKRTTDAGTTPCLGENDSSKVLDSPCTTLIDRYGAPDAQTSPLKDRASPTAPPPLQLTGVPKHLDATPTRRKPAMVIQDSFATTGSWASPTRSQHKASQKADASAAATPMEAPRRPGRDPSAKLGASSAAGRVSTSPDKVNTDKSPKKAVGGLSEIPDSDEEDEGFDAEESMRGGGELEEARDRDEHHFVVGAETQLVMSELASSEALQQSLGRPVSVPARSSSSLSSISEQSSSAAPQAVSCPPATLPRPPPSEHQESRSRQEPSAAKPSTKPIRKPLYHPVSPSQPRQSQPFESQRVHVTILQSLAPPTPRSDILLPLSTVQLEPLVSGHVVHVVMPFKIPTQVVRFWLLERSMLRYMACVEPYPPDGEPLPIPVTGSRGSWRYYVRQVYQLNNPVAEPDMREEGWLDKSEAIGKYVYLPPAMIGQLLWNLRHALFGDDAEEERASDSDEEAVAEAGTTHAEPPEQPLPSGRGQTPSGSLTVSQQVTAQIHSDIAYSTQFIPSTPLDDGQEDQNGTSPRVGEGTTPRLGEPPSSSIKPPPPPPPPPAFAASSSSARRLRTPRQARYTSATTTTTTSTTTTTIRPSQATTASQPSSPEQSHPRPHLHHNAPPARHRRLRTTPNTTTARSPHHHHQPPPQQPSSSNNSLHFLDHGASLVSMPPCSPTSPLLQPGDLPLPSSSSSLPASSQLLTKSQMLPDSLLRDGLPPPPLPPAFAKSGAGAATSAREIWDSDDDDVPL